MSHENTIRSLRAKVQDASITSAERKATQKMLDKLIDKHVTPRRVKSASSVQSVYDHTPRPDQLKQGEWIKVEVPVEVVITRKWAQLKEWYKVRDYYNVAGNNLYAETHTYAAMARSDIAEIVASLKPKVD